MPGSFVLARVKCVARIRSTSTLVTLMPPHLRIACLVLIAALLSMAALAPFYESGASRVTSPILMVLLALIPALFIRRIPWT